MKYETMAIKISKMEVKIENLSAKMSRMCKSIDEIKDFLFNQDDGLTKLLNDHYVRKEDYKIVKSIVFGAVSIILTSVFGALVYLVVK